mmetsp:Transcript_33475/g.32933  ORF Transcript_33475/g.32933 Transcript_33475/m.32933 type:complete len:131 (+) Transcript_33475:1134-1526(+)|eukprot:CAMPEP_0196998570 /NCGR_PEP_ID=MMETSP1380-20130617/3929_1 /TAXON_ID=5936 /ORGANISM="Euplotes crassus, Strain CT5" /LENGTH=130 /DNA_ID=CAMNT_0042415187 /DNA_START=693 /DNA_END=1085 /DNA_ORIENTATION=+
MELCLTNNPIYKKPVYRASVLKRLQRLLILDTKEITPEERERIENTMMPEAKMAPMVQYSQYPSSKVPVKLNPVNFEGVFNNMKSFADQTSPNVGKQSQHKSGSSRGNRGGNNDMANLIQVTSMQTKFMD